MTIEGKDYEAKAIEQVSTSEASGIGLNAKMYHLAVAQVFATLAVAEAIDDVRRATP